MAQHRQNVRELIQGQKLVAPTKLPENKTENEPKAMTNITSPKPQIKEEETNKKEQSTEKCGWGLGCAFCKSQEQKEDLSKETEAVT